MSKLSNKKKIISLISIALLIVIGVAASMISYSIATKGNGDNKSGDIDEKVIGDNSLVRLGDTATYITNIDLIIQKANDAAATNNTFNIVEIMPSGVTDTGLSTYVSDGGFANYVLTANKTNSTPSTMVMPTNKVKYDKLSVSSSTMLTDTYSGTVTVQDLLDAADLIYINSPGYDSYTGTNNMNEDMYNYLHVYSIGKNKPLILDYVVKGQTAAANKTYKDFMVAVKRNYVKYRTYPWSDGVTAENFFKGIGSYYLRYNANNSTTKLSGKVLVLSGSNPAETDSLYTKLEAYKDTMKTAAFYGFDTKKPDEIKFTTIDVKTTAESDIIDALDVAADYNFVIIEKNTADVEISKALYKKLQQVSEASRYMIFDERAISDITSSTVETSTSNYIKLMGLLVTTSGVSRYSNVLAVANGFFTSLDTLGADGTTGAKQVADIINNGNYRDANKSGGVSRKYRVLEIEPCYPIDLDIAENNSYEWTKYTQAGIDGGYYYVPDQILYGVSKDEIDDGTEYYAFELSKAKISHVTGIPVDQMEIDQMSVNQLISTKPVILESYDLVYIGGDASALLPYWAVNYSGKTGFTWSADSNWGNIMTSLTAFDMYSHTGPFVEYQFKYRKVGGDDTTNYVITNGYDISDIKLHELQDYVDAGLPILIDQEVTSAFKKSYDYDPKNKTAVDANRLKQLGLHDIDPDCNMYKFLKYAYENKDTKLNIGWGAINSPTDNKDVDTVRVSNPDGALGNTIKKSNELDSTGNPLGIYATVYNEATEINISNTISNSKKRPKLSLTKYPKEYEEGNSASTNKTKTVSFTASVDQACTVKLFVDANGDGVYSDTEEKDSQSCAAGGSVDLSYVLDDGFFGIVNWKVKATVNGSVLCDAIIGASFFKPDDEMQKTIRVLQIMPVDVDNGAWGDGSGLYFCTECQQATRRLKNNVTIDSNDSKGIGACSNSDNATVWGVTVGKHEHDFGIPIFDSTTQKDDWEENFADVLTHGSDGSLDTGEYIFDLDIVSVEEFDDYCEDASKLTDEQAASNKNTAESLKLNYETAKNAATLKALRTKLETEIYKVEPSIATSGCMYSAVIHKGIGTSAKPGRWMLDHQYYKLFEYLNNGTNSSHSGLITQALKDAYNNYITEYDKVVTLKENAKATARQNGVGYKWLINNYDFIILGLCDGFGDKDLTVLSCEQIRDYVKDGGAVLNSHDTLVTTGQMYSDGTSVNLSNTLREVFGMDRFHVTGYASGSGTSNIIMADARVQVNGFNYSTTEPLPQSFNVYLKQGASGSYDQSTAQKITLTDTDMEYEFTEGLVAVEQTFKIQQNNAGDDWKKFEIKVSDSDVSIDANQTDWDRDNDNLQHAKSSSGTKHTNMTDKLTITVTGVTDGKTFNLYDSTGAKIKTVNASGGTAVFADVDIKTVMGGSMSAGTEGTKHDSGNLTVTFKTPGNGCIVNFNGTDYVAGADGNVKVDVALKFNSSTQGIDDNSVNNNKLGTNAFVLRSDKNGIVVRTVQNAGETISVETKKATTANANTFAVQIYDPSGNPAPAGVYVAVKLTKNNVQKGGNTDASGIVYVTFTDEELSNNKSDVDLSNTKYKRYTSDDSRYFFTERLQAESPDEYPIVENKVSSCIEYNAPLGLTDLFATYDSKSIPRSNYRYDMTEPEAWNHRGTESDGANFQAHYGTRKAAQVNKGGVTMYPFAISSDLLISPTHCQAFALDLEDSSVAVWYTLGGSFASDNPSVPAQTARYASGTYAASPKDGMNSYFLYSKENVFYTGAGHMRVTGNMKDNNDERRLFINVIVNSVSKGKTKPKLRLYNSCDESGHENCDDNYVDPTDSDDNKKLSENSNTLFYNEADEVYQYFVDGSEDKIYPEFDFKAIAGSDSLSKIEVFYDLDYNEKSPDDQYHDDTNHVMITSYDYNSTPVASAMSGKRVRLRQSTMEEKLVLKDEYFNKYNDYTYIVISVTAGSNVKTERVKIIRIPHLFDLTDATIDYEVQGINLGTGSEMDVADSKKYNF